MQRVIVAGTWGAAGLRRRVQRALGWAIVAAGAAIVLAQVVGWPLWLRPEVRGALLGGGLAALATALGTLPVLLRQQFSQRACDAMLGFGAGVMLAACSFSLILPALQATRANGAGAWGASLGVGAAILAGALLLMGMDKVLPHEHFNKGREGPHIASLRRVWLFVAAIALHNLPEGFAIGVAFAGGQAGGQALSLGIAMQDVPEGLVVALALRAAGYGRLASAGLGIATGVVEPLAALAGVLLAGISATVLPIGLAMAAGAMLYVISHEIIPESHRQGHERAATCGLVLGFIVMLTLDTATV